jgi:hypothetical protein
MKTWKILDYGKVPKTSSTIPYTCRCGYEAQLPVVGRVLVVTGNEEDGDVGIVFDTGPHAIPTTIRCRKCGRTKTTAKEKRHVREVL